MNNKDKNELNKVDGKNDNIEVLAKENSERIEMYLESANLLILALTALLTTLATWFGSVYAGKQSELYLQYNNLSTSAYNEHLSGTLKLNQDKDLQRSIDILTINYLAAEMAEDYRVMYETSQQIVRSMHNFNYEQYAKEVLLWDKQAYADFNSKLSKDEEYMEHVDKLYDYIDDWTMDYSERKAVSTDLSDFIDVNSVYYSEYAKLTDEASAAYDKGNKCGEYGDKYNIAVIMYSCVLFLMGIYGVFNNTKSRIIILSVSGAVFLFAFVYMLAIPIPY